MLDKLALNTHERVQHQRRGAATFDQTTQGLKGLPVTFLLPILCTHFNVNGWLGKANFFYQLLFWKT